MNRSVISVVIAAGVLSAASGIVTVPVAVAEPAQPVAGNDADAGPGGAGVTARGPRNPGRGGKPSADGAAPGRPSAGSLVGSPSLWPCPWPVVPPVARPETEPEAGGGGGVPVGPMPIVAPAAPQARISGGVQRAGPDLLPIEALPDLLPIEALPAPAMSAPTMPAPVLAPVGIPQPQPVAPVPKPAGPAAPAAPLAPVAPVASAPTAQRAPVVGAVPPAAVPSPPAPPATAVDAGQRLGYPEALRSADTATLATMALPGLAVILGMTAVGGLVGYRQAKAGSALRAAGAGRFLQ